MTIEGTTDSRGASQMASSLQRDTVELRIVALLKNKKLVAIPKHIDGFLVLQPESRLLGPTDNILNWDVMYPLPSENKVMEPVGPRAPAGTEPNILKQEHAVWGDLGGR